jgi:hypothetical protein
MPCPRLQEHLNRLEEKATAKSVPDLFRTVQALRKTGATHAVQTILDLIRADQDVRREALETVQYLRELE